MYSEVDRHFPRDTVGVADAISTSVMKVGDGERCELRIAPVRKQIGEASVRMLGYNGSIPGPTLRVRQDTTILVDVINEGDHEATVHWHGLRLENRYDGTAHEDPGHEHAAAGGIEWEDDMVEINKITTPANMRWKLVDRTTGQENAAIDWTFTLGDRAKIRLVNEMDSDHPMHHPFHIHGAGRFLVLTRNGEVDPNLVWKDTVLVRTGEIVDILLDVTNPGLWMAHCHIAEHHESGMMFSFNVSPGDDGRMAAKTR